MLSLQAVTVRYVMFSLRRRAAIKGYIQHIGFEPFFIINYTAEQIAILHRACRERTFLYVDATGLSMRRPMDQKRRIYLYIMVLKESEDTAGICIAEMLTNDHSMASISNFLFRIRQALTKDHMCRRKK